MTLRVSLPSLALLAIGCSGLSNHGAQGAGEPIELKVWTTADAGRGSLRAAIKKAIATGQPAVIRFDSVDGPFAEPREIVLHTPLPPITGSITIDGYIPDRLWQATGVTVSGGGRLRIFDVTAKGELTLRNLTLANGRAEDGGAVRNEGRLLVHSSTLMDNAATRAGGAIVNRGSVELINATLYRNAAGIRGGALALAAGDAVITHVTIAANSAPEGAGMVSDARMILRNSIAARNEGSEDCKSQLDPSPGSGSNLIGIKHGCGPVISNQDPRLGSIGLYNGPTPTLPLEGVSPAVNMADNAASLDVDGRVLAWDQRGNGDPRFVAGIADLGAFERQYVATLIVDTDSDADVRGCSATLQNDCSLRGAIALADNGQVGRAVRFDAKVFGTDHLIELQSQLPVPSAPVILDGTDVGGVSLRFPSRIAPFDAESGSKYQLLGIKVLQAPAR